MNGIDPVIEDHPFTFIFKMDRLPCANYIVYLCLSRGLQVIRQKIVEVGIDHLLQAHAISFRRYLV